MFFGIDMCEIESNNGYSMILVGRDRTCIKIIDGGCQQMNSIGGDSFVI